MNAERSSKANALKNSLETIALDIAGMCNDVDDEFYAMIEAEGINNPALARMRADMDIMNYATNSIAQAIDCMDMLKRRYADKTIEP